MKKRILSLILALAFIMSILPLAVYTSAETGAEAGIAITMSDCDFGTVAAGYYKDHAMNPRLENVGTVIYQLGSGYNKVELTSGDISAFTCGINQGPGAISVGSNSGSSVYVRNVSGLEAGTYTATLSLYHDFDGTSGENYDWELVATSTVTFTVIAPKAAPTITITGDVASWTEVEGASSYIYMVKNYGGYEDTTAFNVKDALMFCEADSGTYTVSVYACDAFGDKLSEVATADYVFIAAEPYAEGDVNGDGSVDIFDYMAVKSHYFEKSVLTEDELSRADLSPDGLIDMFDYMALKTICFA